MDHSRHVSPYQSRTSSSSWRRHHRNPSAHSLTRLNTKQTRKSSRAASETHSAVQSSKVQWKALFCFTTRRHVAVVVLSTIFALIVGAVTPIQSYLMGKVFSAFAKFAAGTITDAQFKHDVFVSNMYFVGLGTISWIFTTIFFAGWVLFGELQAQRAREQLFGALIARRISWFDQRKDGMGGMTAKLQSFIVELQTATAQPIGLALRDLTTAVASLGLALYQSWKLTLVIISTLPIAFLVVPFISAKVQPAITKQQEVLSEAAKHITNSFGVIEAVKAYNGQGVENWRYSLLLKKAEKYYYRQVQWNALQTAILRVITLIMFVQGFWYGSTLVDKTKNTNAAGNILTAFWSCVMATSAIMQVMPQLMMLEKGKVAGQRLSMVMGSASTDRAESDARTITPRNCVGDIELEQVHFAYPSRPQQPVLKGVSLFFAAGDLTFIIGKSGSGKSTIGQLLMQFYQSTSGTIKLDDNPIQHVDAKWLREHILLVEQTSVLFNTTLEENLALGSQSHGKVSQSAIEEATRFAEVHETIEKMPYGLQTKVGAKGGSLSGGQRQRIALARAKIRDPAILILDESTSALDYINRIAVLEAIRKWRAGRTTLIITHDISQILPKDFVYIMRDGEVVQSGFRSAMEQLEGSPFHDFSHTPSKRRSRRWTTLNEMPMPPLPEDAVLHSDSECDSDGSVSSSVARQDSGGNAESDVLDAYLDEPARLQTSKWVPFSPQMEGSNRNSMQIPQQFGAPLWGVMPSSRMSNIFGANMLGMPATTTASRPKQMHFIIETEEASESLTPTAGKRFSQASWGLGRSLSRRISSRTSSRPKSYVVSLKSPVAPSPISPETEDLEFDLPGAEVVAAEEKQYTLTQILKTVWPQLKVVQRAGMIFGLLATVAYAASTPLFAFVFSKLLATLYNPVDRKAKALKYSLAILGIALGDGLTIFISTANIQSLGQTWVNQLRRKALEMVLEQPREFFDLDENSASRMTECLDQHAEMMQHILGRFVGNILIVVVMVVMAITWSLVSSWQLTLVLLATTPILVLVTSGLSSVGAVMERRSQNAREEASAIFAETFMSIKTVRTLTLEDHFEKLHKAASDKALKIGIRKGIYVGVFYGLSQSVLLYVIALIFFYGSVLVRNGTYKLNSILEVFTLLLLSVSTATMILASMPQLAVSREAAARVLRLTDLPPTNHEHDGHIQIPSIGDITFDSVRFRYPSRPERLVLKDVSLSIPTGSSVALVGTSGSGKSTIAALLLKLYQTSAAQESSSAHDITLNNRSIAQTLTPTLRNLISIVSQTPALFPTSISGNIVYGMRATDPRNTAANVKAAAISAGIHDFIASLPEGYDTLIGDGGMGLSGGQAQRVAIARALARRPDVLILDEATSALDVESASMIRHTITHLLRESRLPGAPKALTVLIITHAREMMQIADRVVMLDGGRVVEQGAYDDLLAGEGKFAKLMRAEGWEKDVRRTRRRSVLMMHRSSGVLSPGREVGWSTDGLRGIAE